MTALNIAIVLTGFISITILIYFLRQDKARISRKKLIITAIVTGIIFAALYPLWEMKFGNAIQSVDLYVLAEFLIISPPAFFIYPKKPNKNLFFISTTTPLLVAGHGLGNLSEIMFKGGAFTGRLLNLLVMNICMAVIVGGIFWLTRKKFPGLYESENPKLWRRLFIITLMMGLSQLAAGNVFSADSFTPLGIIPSRLICLVGMGAILFIAGLAKRQAEESSEVTARAEAAEQAVKAKAESYAAIVKQMEESNRFRHDRRQILAAIDGLNVPGKEKELESYCREFLSQLNLSEDSTDEFSESKITV
ncbi:MAG: hypothetical protein LBM87_02615 [Ruminococcus sp.]|jgi:hypothetical protein|nr:hypothetical protein [Ruminococcus sp.]